MNVDNMQASDMLTRILDEVEGGTPAAREEAPKTASVPPTADLVSLLPTILSALPQGGGTQGGGAPAGRGTQGGGPQGGGSSGAKGQPPDRHTALLCAVKPYLGERRQATADTVIRLCRLWDALSRAGLSTAVLNGLLGGGTPPSQESGSEGRAGRGEVD